MDDQCIPEGAHLTCVWSILIAHLSLSLAWPVGLDLEEVWQLDGKH